MDVMPAAHQLPLAVLLLLKVSTSTTLILLPRPLMLVPLTDSVVNVLSQKVPLQQTALLTAPRPKLEVTLMPLLPLPKSLRLALLERDPLKIILEMQLLAQLVMLPNSAQTANSQLSVLLASQETF